MDRTNHSAVSEAWTNHISHSLHMIVWGCRTWAGHNECIPLITQLTLFMDCPLRPWPVHIAQPSPGVDCPHRPWPSKNSQSTSGVAYPPYPLACRMVNRCYAWPSCIAIGSHIVVIWCQTWTSCIAFGLHTLVSWHQMWFSRIALVCTHWSINFERRLRLSFVACTHLSTNIGRGLPESSIASTECSIIVGVACQHRLYPSHIGLTWPGHITYDLHTFDFLALI